ncbi:GntR family transcriptional regulator [Marinilabiliaceae bacterium JC017]|nr:GntR family transcriptional regulator [Marinilabiliaceae bacterium JC017]
MELKIDHKSPLPLHAQVEQLLRQLITQPEYQAGNFLPKEVDLAKMLGVSRNTIRQATNKLEYEGLLIRKKGVGTKVTQQTVTTQLANWGSFTQEMNEQGVNFINYEIKASLENVNGKIATFMGVPDGTEVIKIVRLRGDEDIPFVYFESYIHPRVGLTIDEDFSQPLYDLLEKKYATIVTLSKEHISARSASRITAKRLQIDQGEPILKRERFVYDPGNRPVEYNIGFYRADKFTYSIDITR